MIFLFHTLIGVFNAKEYQAVMLLAHGIVSTSIFFYSEIFNELHHFIQVRENNHLSTVCKNEQLKTIFG